MITYRPLPGHLLLLDSRDCRGGILVDVDDVVRSNLLSYTVVAVASDVVDVGVGDVVILTGDDMGSNLQLDGVRFIVVPASEAVAVIE